MMMELKYEGMEKAKKLLISLLQKHANFINPSSVVYRVMLEKINTLVPIFKVEESSVYMIDENALVLSVEYEDYKRLYLYERVKEVY